MPDNGTDANSHQGAHELCKLLGFFVLGFLFHGLPDCVGPRGETHKDPPKFAQGVTLTQESPCLIRK